MPKGVYERTEKNRRPLSEEHKRKISAAKQGHPVSEETRQKISASVTGFRHTEETKARIGAASRGKTLSEEHRRKISAAHQDRSLEFCDLISKRQKGKRFDRTVATGYYIDESGYRFFTGHQDHPLADRRGVVAEHRQVLYDNIGPGPHPCHWACGKVLGWGGKNGINVDHLDDDRTNNDPENLVPSCGPCNRQRGK